MCLDHPDHHLELSPLIQPDPSPHPDHPQMSSLDPVRCGLDSGGSSLVGVARHRGMTVLPLAVRQGQ